jgi:hypothetical protein
MRGGCAMEIFLIEEWLWWHVVMQMLTKWLQQGLSTKPVICVLPNKCIWLWGSCNGVHFGKIKHHQKSEAPIKVNDNLINILN